MVLFHCTDPELASAVRGALPAAALLQHAADWPAFERAAATAAVLCVHLPEGSAAQSAPRLRQLRARHPAHPLVVVTPRDPDAMRHLLNVGVAELVWSHEAAAELPRVLAQLRAHGIAARIAARIDESGIEPPCLRAALAAAVRAAHPPTRVADLAALAHCNRTTLWRWWQCALAPGAALKPSCFMDWVLLVHAVDRRLLGQKWGRVADDLGIHEHTLARLARRCTGAPLGQLDASDSITVLRRFEVQVLDVFSHGAKQSHRFMQQFAVEQRMAAC
jgi:hypothetical protein